MQMALQFFTLKAALDVTCSESVKIGEEQIMPKDKTKRTINSIARIFVSYLPEEGLLTSLLT